MKRTDTRNQTAAQLRHLAEDKVQGGSAPRDEHLAQLPPEQMRAVLHELQVHQIELELQNEELRRAQVELDALRARYFDLYDLAPVGYCTINARGVIEEANFTAAAMLGVGRRDVVGQLMSRFVLPEDQDIFYRHRNQLIATADRQVFRLRLLHPFGPPFWTRLEATLDEAGENGSLVCRVALSDISENKRAEEALAESELRYRTLADSGQALIWTAGLDKQCNYFNQPWLDFTGRTLEQECGEGWVQGVHPQDLDHCLKTYVTAFDQREKFSMEYRLRHASGEYRWLQDDGTPRFDDSGQFLGYIGHCLDITARKQAEEGQKMLQEQLIQAQKMESVGRLAGGVAHDFNNMLTIILGYVEMVQVSLDPGSPLFSDLEEVRKAAKRSAALTAQLLAFARKQIVTPEVLDLNKTLEEMLRLLQSLIGENIDLVWAPGADLWPVRIDPSQLNQILANLCMNARDAIAGVGKISVETDNAVLDAEFCTAHHDVVPGAYVLLVVSDNGCGMDKETLANLFEPFFTTKELGKGTGLGLATVYGIVKQNNGFVNVHSVPGQGTTFNIYLPRHDDRTELFLQEIPAAPVHGGRETILLVEDESAILKMTANMLQGQGYTVLAAASPGRAIELAGKQGEIDLLLTDVIMPEMNGWDLARRLLERRPQLRQLYMSGYTADVIASHGVLDEGVNFIEKPFTLKNLALKVRAVLEQ